MLLLVTYALTTNKDVLSEAGTLSSKRVSAGQETEVSRKAEVHPKLGICLVGLVSC